MKSIPSADGWIVAYIRPEGVTLDYVDGGSREVSAEHFERIAEAWETEKRRVQVLDVNRALQVAAMLWQQYADILDWATVLPVEDVPGQAYVRLIGKGDGRTYTLKTQGDVDDAWRVLNEARQERMAQ